MVDHQVKYDAHAVLAAPLLHAIEVFERAVHGIDVNIVRNIVTEVNLRRGETRGYPDSVDAEPLQVVELRGDTVQVANTIVVRVHEAAGIDLIEDSVLPPGMAFGIDGRVV